MRADADLHASCTGFWEEALEECLFCNIQRGLVPAIGDPLYEDDLVYAHHYHGGEERTHLGHPMLETKRHTPVLRT